MCWLLITSTRSLAGEACHKQPLWRRRRSLTAASVHQKRSRRRHVPLLLIGSARDAVLIVTWATGRDHPALRTQTVCARYAHGVRRLNISLVLAQLPPTGFVMLALPAPAPNGW
jgi:hypothetical protein